MTADIARAVRLIDHDRREIANAGINAASRIGNQAQRFTVNAVKYGHDPVRAARAVLLGNENTEHASIADVLAHVMLVSNLKGRRRSVLNARGHVEGLALARTDKDQRKLDDEEAALLALLLLTEEEIAALRGFYLVLANKLVETSAQALFEQLGEMGLAEIRQRFIDAGLAGAEPYTITNLFSTAGVRGYEDGRYEASQNEQIQDALYGFHYSAILDDRTCFAAGTLVQLADGTRQPIDTIQIGQQVITGNGRSKRVLGIKKQIARKWCVVKCEDGSETTATITHPFWTLRSGRYCWVEVGALKVGDQLATGHLCEPKMRKAVHLRRLGIKAIKQVLQPEVLLCGEEQGRMAKEEMPVVQELVQGSDDLHAASRRRGTVLLSALHSNGSEAGIVARGNDIQMRDVRQTVRAPSRICASRQTWSMVLAGLSPKTRTAEMPTMRPGVYDFDFQFGSVLFARVLSPVIGRNQIRGNGADGIRGREDSISARSSARSIHRRLLGIRQTRDRSQRKLLAQFEARAGNRSTEGGGNSEAGLETSRISRRQREHKSQVGVSSCANHAPIPNATGSTRITGITFFEHEQAAFDLEIEDDHSYLVQTGLIVHNTELCQTLDGTILPKDDPFWIRWKPPNHFRCRSVVIEVWKSSALREPTPVPLNASIEQLARFAAEKQRFLSYF